MIGLAQQNVAHQYEDNSDSLKDSSEEREKIMAAGLAASREGSMVASFEKKSQDLEVNEIESGDDEDKS